MIVHKRNRLKASIDSRIAEEQARQRLPQSSPSRSDSTIRRSSSRTTSPSKRPTRQGARGRQNGDSLAKSPDPADFEPEFVIGDDGASRAGTPKPASDRSVTSADKQHDQEPAAENTSGNHDMAASFDSGELPKAPVELPTDVRVKLRKLEKLESRYHELLRSYRVAHARVLLIEPFETSLRENTPLTSIGDPNALVEYLNQVNLKGDMVLDELKRVSTEKDSISQRLRDAEKSTKEAWDEVASLRKERAATTNVEDPEERPNGIHAEDEANAPDLHGGDPLLGSTKSPSHSIKSPSVSIRGVSLFSPKLKSVESPSARKESDDLFSYDDEIPRLQSEFQAKQDKINDLTHEVKTLKGDLAVARESTQSMVQTLEEATRDVSNIKEGKERAELDLKEQQMSSGKLAEQLRTELRAAEDRIVLLQSSNTSRHASRVEQLEKQLLEATKNLGILQSTGMRDAEYKNQVEELQSTIGKLELDISGLRDDSNKSKKKIDTLNSLTASLRSQLTEAEASNKEMTTAAETSSKAFEALEKKVHELESKPASVDKVRLDVQQHSRDVTLNQAQQAMHHEPANTQETTSLSKKKNKKKKKSSKLVAEQEMGNDAQTKEEDHPLNVGPKKSTAQSDTAGRLQQELERLRALVEEKDAAVERAHDKLKDQEGLREEIETLRDDLINVGQEHVEAKDKMKGLLAEKTALETTVAGLEKELAALQGTQASTTAGTEQKQKDLAVQFEDLQAKAVILRTDLSAAQQLASSRFKDLNDLRNTLQKAQPEINALRSEAAEMKTIKEALSRKDAEFKRLDTRHEEMRSEVGGFKQTLFTKEAEIKTLHRRISQETFGRSKAEDECSKAAQETQRVESERRQVADSLDRLSKELTRSREELSTSKGKLRELEQQLSKHRSDSEGLKEEVELKSAQYASAQSLMASMRDQTAEMVTQMKEVRERCESLDEEVADAHRLLSERSREGETMRRLLADVEGRADARTREMKERVDTAIEERDRAEDEASTAGRRRARELEDLRNKYRDIERNLKRAEDDKEELETAQRDWKRRREELEHRASESTHEVEEVRKAMGEMRDALDQSERQARDLEKQKSELRRSVEDTQSRLERSQKSNKSMADEIGKIQTAKTKVVNSEAQSSRSSFDSTARLGSPAPKSRTSSVAFTDAPNGQPQGSMDYVYLKNVLLQFLEQRDKKHQMQLIPVLGMLLHFDRKDEQKWMSAITTK